MHPLSKSSGQKKGVIPPERVHYLAEIASSIRDYHNENSRIAERLRALQSMRITKLKSARNWQFVERKIEDLQESKSYGD